MFDEIDKHVIPEVLWRGEKGAPTVQLRHLFNETAQRAIGIEQ